MADAPPVAPDDAVTVAPEDSGDFRSSGPVVTLLIGMAGSGKTTLFHRLHYDATEKGRRGPAFELDARRVESGSAVLDEGRCARRGTPRRRCYFINLDPAVLEVPIEPQIDIRDTIDYKGIMREYRLGPNGAIVTALNLFATQFADVMKILEKRASEFDHAAAGVGYPSEAPRRAPRGSRCAAPARAGGHPTRHSTRVEGTPTR